MTKIAAILVTYNRESLLKLSIENILSQSRPIDQLIIVDNDSRDGTSSLLNDFHQKFPDLIMIVKLNENIGGAGGFYHGMDIALQTGIYDFLWLMDDDCIPSESALNELIVAVDESMKHGVLPGFACSIVKHPEGQIANMNSPSLPWDWHSPLGVGLNNVVKSTACSFVSVLIPSFYIKKVGLPLAEYFIWFDDSEYTMRLSKLSDGIVALKSHVYHHTKENIGVNFGMVSPKSLWKYEYGARNQSSYIMHHLSIFKWFVFMLRTNQQMFKSGCGLKIKFSINKAILKGIIFNPKIRYPNAEH